MSFVGSKLLGVVVTRVSTAIEHKLGEVVVQQDGSQYRYILAAEAIAQYEPVDFTAAYSASVTDNGDQVHGVAQVAIASGSYGWILEHGMGVILVTASLAASDLGQVSAAGGLMNIVNEATLGDGTRGVSYATEASTPAGVACFLF